MDLTIKDLAEFLFGKMPTSVPPWPPDAFALCAAILHRSGAYIHVVSNWPPTGTAKDWASEIEKIGAEWRSLAAGGDTVPVRVADWWKTIDGAGEHKLSKLRERIDVCEAVLQLAAAADQSCANIGLP